MFASVRIQITERSQNDEYRRCITLKWAKNGFLCLRVYKSTLKGLKWQEAPKEQGNINDFSERKGTTMKEKGKIYDLEQWEADWDFKAAPGQEVTEDIYEYMLGVVPPLTLPKKAAKKVCSELGLTVSAGFLMGEPNGHREDGELLYRAFGSRVSDSGERYFYLGLYPAKYNQGDGAYYYFDCMNMWLAGKLWPVTEFKDEQEALDMAADHEAILRLYEYEDGDLVRMDEVFNPWKQQEGSEGK